MTALNGNRSHSRTKTPETRDRTPAKARSPKRRSSESGVARSRIVFIAGPGCGSSDQQRLLQKIAGSSTVDVECESSSAKNTVLDIRKTLCAMRPTTSSEFVRRVHDDIVRHLGHGDRVLLLGHSHGGSAAAAVCKLLSASQHHSDSIMSGLTAVTYGAMSVPPARETAHVNVTHFMKRHDVAMQCNALRKPPRARSSDALDEATRVVWLGSRTTAPPAGRRFEVNPFGISEDWDREYAALMYTHVASFHTGGASKSVGDERDDRQKQNDPRVTGPDFSGKKMYMCVAPYDRKSDQTTSKDRFNSCKLGVPSDSDKRGANAYPPTANLQQCVEKCHKR